MKMEFYPPDAAVDSDSNSSSQEEINPADDNQIHSDALSHSDSALSCATSSPDGVNNHDPMSSNSDNSDDDEINLKLNNYQYRLCYPDAGSDDECKKDKCVNIELPSSDCKSKSKMTFSSGIVRRHHRHKLSAAAVLKRRRRIALKHRRIKALSEAPRRRQTTVTKKSKSRGHR